MDTLSISPSINSYWTSFSGSSSRRSTGGESFSLSKNQRCFTATPSEQAASINYYSGTPTITPGPGTYDIKRNKVESRESKFITSSRILSNSGRYYVSDDLSVPIPGTYNLTKVNTEEQLASAIGVTKHNIKILSQQIDSSNPRKQDELRQQLRFMKKRLTSLLQLQTTQNQQIEQQNNNSSRRLPPFSSSGKREFQKQDKIQEAPTFYLSEKHWDFGSDKRQSSINMAAFQYDQKFNELSLQEYSKTSVLVGEKRPKSQCRHTDFFGWNRGEHNHVPGAGSYTPPILIAQVNSSDTASLDDTSTLSSSFSSMGSSKRSENRREAFDYLRKREILSPIQKM